MTALAKAPAHMLDKADAVSNMRPEITTAMERFDPIEQRFLAAIAAWRIGGGMALPASSLLELLPALHGLPFEKIQAAALRLVDAETLRVVDVEVGDDGNPTKVGFIWPALESMLEKCAIGFRRPRLTDIQGNPL